MDRIDRRTALGLGIGLGLASMLAGCAGLDDRPAARSGTGFRDIEARAGGRLGVRAIDTATGRATGWREHERFAHCSSFKLSLAALVLRGARQGRWRLDERLRWSAAELLFNSPVTSLHVADGMAMAELARATLITSDNTAANVLLARLGGPQALNAFWRSIGDRTSRLDHNEPDLNVVPPGSRADTTTPAAMAATVARLVAGEVLERRDRAMLMQWMAECATGGRRLRAGFPAGWIAGDKTGTGIHPRSTTYVDLAYGGPPGRPPIVVAAYFRPDAPAAQIDPAAEAVLAAVARVSAELLLLRS